MLAAAGVLVRGGPGRHRARHGNDSRRSRARRFRLVARPRGRPFQHRETADGARRRRRQAAAHRTLAQRPGRHRPAALAARGDRCAHRRARRAAPGVHRSRRIPRGDDHARATRICRSRSPSLSAIICWPTKRCSRATPSGFARLPPAREPAPAGKRGARGHELSDRPRRAWQRSSGSRRFARIRSTPFPTAISPIEFTRRRRVDDDPRVAVRRGARAGGRTRASRSSRSRTASAPARRSCRRRRTRTWRSSRAARPGA